VGEGSDTDKSSDTCSLLSLARHLSSLLPSSRLTVHLIRIQQSKHRGGVSAGSGSYGEAKAIKSACGTCANTGRTNVHIGEQAGDARTLPVDEVPDVKLPCGLESP
jgi:hypothetical protein